ncbi:MAG: tyrosine-protein phosphatase [Acetanaerobacterium sp.]
MQQLSQPLPLLGAKNVRELGGYRTQSGAITKTHSLLRADALHNLTNDDCRLLYDYGVRCIIDLRSAGERAKAVDRLPALYPDVEYAVVALQDPVRTRRYSDEFPPSMWELYRWLLDDSAEQFRAVFETILRHQNDCVIFHCSGGKDRTGMVAMLLLKLSEVDDETVIADYALTEALMSDVFVVQTLEMQARGLVVPPYIMQSPPENMVKALAHLKSVYGTAGNYLSSIGLHDDQIEMLLRKLVNETTIL